MGWSGILATREDAQELAGELPDTYLMCREMLHAWMPFDGSVGPVFSERVLRCVRCETKRYTSINSRTGAIMSQKYEYPEGYTRKGFGRMGKEARGALRLVSMDRTLSFPVTRAVTTGKRRKAS